MILRLCVFVCLYLLCFCSEILPDGNNHVPAIAMVCGKNTQHRDLKTGKWVSDPSNNKDCMKTAAQILAYCQEMYPHLKITDVIEESGKIRVNAWCSLGHIAGKCQGRSHNVAPMSCVAGRYEHPGLDVPASCSFQYIKNQSLCKLDDFWTTAAHKRCQDMSMELQGNYSPMKQCKIPNTWHGIEFTCCPPETVIVVPKLPSDPICSLPIVVGMCKAAFPKFYYNTKSGQCEHFTYGGCGGNENNFNNLEECENRCLPGSKETIDQGPVVSLPLFAGVGPVILDDPPKVETASDPICSKPKVVGMCRAAFQRFYYNPESRQCEHFTYGGCGGNENNFERFEDCQDKCPSSSQETTEEYPTTVVPVIIDQGGLEVETSDPICSLPMVVGMCVAAFPSFYYNTKSGQCEHFTYGGCGGNENNFNNVEECENRCLPTSKDLYDDPDSNIDDVYAAQNSDNSVYDNGMHDTSDNNLVDVEENLDVQLQLSFSNAQKVYDYAGEDYVTTASSNKIIWICSVAGSLIIVLILVVTSCYWMKNKRARRFTRVQVRDHLTPEERQLVKMQQNGYENPTYKFFEKKQLV